MHQHAFAGLGGVACDQFRHANDGVRHQIIEDLRQHDQVVVAVAPIFGQGGAAGFGAGEDSETFGCPLDGERREIQSQQSVASGGEPRAQHAD